METNFGDRIRKVQRLVEEAGFDFSATHFPYTYHHNLVREKGGGHSRSEVADKMGSFRGKHGDHAYEAVIVLGAVLYLAREQPLVFARAMGDPLFSGCVAELVTDTTDLPLLFG